MAKKQESKMETVKPVGNGGKESIEYSVPYSVEVTVEGSSPMLFHRWDNESIAEKALSNKGSKSKKEDNVESYVYRNEKGQICIPTEYFRQSIINAAKFKQDPRSSRKSAVDLFKAGIVALDELASLGTKDWDYLDKRRVTIQKQSGITRVRPAFEKGWKTTFRLMVNLPEYIDNNLLQELVVNAGRLIGVGDFRPTYGRYNVTGFKVLKI